MPEGGTKLARFVDWIASAPDGRTMEQIYKWGFETGIISKKTQARTTVWHGRQRGLLEKRGGRNDGRFYAKRVPTSNIPDLLGSGVN